MKKTLLFFFLVFAKSVSAQHAGDWESAGKDRLPARQCSSVCIAGETPVIFGGYDGKKMAREFSLLKDGKLISANLKYPGQGFANSIIFYEDSSLFVGGGIPDIRSRSSTEDFWKYDFRTATWTRLGNLPFLYLGKAEHEIVKDRHLIITSTYAKDRKTLSSVIYTYNIKEDVWAVESACPNKALFHPLSFVIGDQVYVYFESDRYANIFSGELMKYDPAAGMWARLSKFPFAQRLAAFAFTDGGYGYVGGGLYDTDLTDVYRYDPARDEWTVMGAVPGPANFANDWTMGDDVYPGFGVSMYSKENHIWKFRK